MLCPSVKAHGRITRAHQLDCTVEVVEGEEKRKLVEVLDVVYQVSLCQLFSTLDVCLLLLVTNMRSIFYSWNVS